MNCFSLVDGLVETLQDGAQCADVGCGTGLAVLEMAKAFPNSTFHGYDVSKSAIAAAEKAKKELKIENAVFHDVSAGDVVPSDGTLSFVFVNDAIHDMVQPKQMLQAIRAALKPDGVFVNIEPGCADSTEENLKLPAVAMLSGFSLHLCLQSSMSEAGGAGLGTLGYGPKLCREWIEEVGFSRHKFHDGKDWKRPGNMIYEARP